MNNALLRISDGTTTVDLISATQEGFHLTAWDPATVEYKGGGVWRDSPLASGRVLSGKYFGNGIETMTVSVKGHNADDMAERIQRLRQLLEKAADYWVTRWANRPVYVMARAPGETNTRYAAIYAGRLTTDKNYYASPFTQPDCSPLMPDISLTFERAHWQSTAPSARECALPQIPIRRTFTPLEKADDVQIDETAMTLDYSSGDYMIMGDNGGSNYSIGVRFRNVNIPQGAKILAATIGFENHNSQSSTTVNLRVYGKLDANPPNFGLNSYTAYLNSTLTEAYVNWNGVEAMVSGNDYNTPDLSTVVQEIVDLTAWESGKNMVLFVKDNASSNNANRLVANHENAFLRHPPLLTVTWLTNADPCTDDDYTTRHIVLAKRTRAQITGIYYYDASATEFSDNLLNDVTGSEYPMDGLVSSDIQTGDIWYFQSGPASAHTGPFDNINFHFGDDPGTLTIAWEYYAGAGVWSALTTEDYTDNLNAVGRCSVHWNPPSDWQSFGLSTIGGTNNPSTSGFTVRARVTAVSNPDPRGLLSHPYTVTWPFVEFKETAIPGDIPALTQIEARYRHSGGGEYVDWVLYALRSVNRGDNFDAYLNCSNEQHAFGLTATAGTNTTFTANTFAPTGYLARCTFGTSTMQNRVTFTFTSALAIQYLGRFRIFLTTRASTPPSGNPAAQIRVEIGAFIFDTDSVALDFPNEFNIHDLGLLDLSALDTGEVLDTLVLRIRAQAGSIFEFIGLILMPVDEFAVELDGSVTSISIDAADYLDADSVGYPKFPLYATSRVDATDAFKSSVHTKAIPPFILHANKRQRLFVLQKEATEIFSSSDALALAPYKASRFLTLRGRK